MSQLETAMLLIEILERIPKSGSVTALMLQAQLEDNDIYRSKRSIERYLQLLCSHFSIECDDSAKPYRYSWVKNSKGFSVPSLTEKESLLLKLAEEYLRPLLPDNLFKSLTPFFSQASEKLLESQSLEGQWLKKVKVVSQTQPLLPAKIDDCVFEEVSRALFYNKKLKVTYKNQSGKENTYQVLPLGLAQQGVRLYLVCRFEGHSNERSLALHRIIDAKAMTLTFDYPEDFSFDQFNDDAQFGFGEGKKIQLSFRVSKPAGFHLLETPLSKDQKVVEHREDYEIQATVVDSLQLDWWLKSFGENVSHIKKLLNN